MRGACGAFVVLAAGCATTGTRAPSADACTLGGAVPATSIRVAVAAHVTAARAPLPASRHERLVLAQVHDPLLRVGCDGTLLPGLATSWAISPDGLTWQFTLRHDPPFADDTPLDAATIAAAFSRWPEPPPFAGVAVMSEYVLQVRLYQAGDAAHFARPLVLQSGHADADRANGTGAYRADTAGAALRLVKRVASYDSPDTLHVAHLVAGAERSALDAGVDLLVTAEPATIAYALLLEPYTTTPLSWDRTYVLAAPGAEVALWPTMAERDALARDAAPVGTRAAPDTFPAACGAFPRSTAAPATLSAPRAIGRVLYARDDAVARGIAERLAALSWPASRTPAWLRARIGAESAPLVAEALDAHALRAAMLDARDAAFVIGVHHCPAGDPVAAALGRSHLQSIPLVEARDHVIRRAGVGVVVVDGTGTVRFGVRP